MLNPGHLEEPLPGSVVELPQFSGVVVGLRHKSKQLVVVATDGRSERAVSRLLCPMCFFERLYVTVVCCAGNDRR